MIYSYTVETRTHQAVRWYQVAWTDDIEVALEVLRLECQSWPARVMRSDDVQVVAVFVTGDDR